eukprot:2538612-Rhodomonas_salina.1
MMTRPRTLAVRDVSSRHGRARALKEEGFHQRLGARGGGTEFLSLAAPHLHISACRDVCTRGGADLELRLSLPVEGFPAQLQTLSGLAPSPRSLPAGFPSIRSSQMPQAHASTAQFPPSSMRSSATLSRCRRTMEPEVLGQGYVRLCSHAGYPSTLRGDGSA